MEATNSIKTGSSHRRTIWILVGLIALVLLLYIVCCCGPFLWLMLQTPTGEHNFFEEISRTTIVPDADDFLTSFPSSQNIQLGNIIFFLPDGNSILREEDDNLIIQPIQGSVGKVKRLRHPNKISSTALSPDGSLAATCLRPPESETTEIWIWNLADSTHEFSLQLERKSCGFYILIAPNNDYIALASFNQSWPLELWELKNMSRLPVEGLAAAAFSPGGNFLAGNNNSGRITLWNLADLQPKRQFEYLSGYIASLTFSADGRWLAGSSPGGANIYLWDLSLENQSTPAITLHMDSQQLKRGGLSFSPDGQFLAASKYYGWTGPTEDSAPGNIVVVWRLSDKTVEKMIKITGYRSLAPFRLDYSPDGELLAVGTDSRLYIYRLRP